MDAGAGAFGHEGAQHGGACLGGDGRGRALRRVLAQDALGPAGGARGVEHGLAAEGLVVGRARQRLDLAPGAESCEGVADGLADEEAAGRVDPARGLAGDPRIAGVDDDGVGFAVLDYVGDILGGPAAGHGREAPARPGRAAIACDVLGGVREQAGDRAAGGDAGFVEGSGEAGRGGEGVGVAEEMDRDLHGRRK